MHLYPVCGFDGYEQLKFIPTPRRYVIELNIYALVVVVALPIAQQPTRVVAAHGLYDACVLARDLICCLLVDVEGHNVHEEE